METYQTSKKVLSLKIKTEKDKVALIKHLFEAQDGLGFLSSLPRERGAPTVTMWFRCTVEFAPELKRWINYLATQIEIQVESEEWIIDP